MRHMVCGMWYVVCVRGLWLWRAHLAPPPPPRGYGRPPAGAVVVAVGVTTLMHVIVGRWRCPWRQLRGRDAAVAEGRGVRGGVAGVEGRRGVVGRCRVVTIEAWGDGGGRGLEGEGRGRGRGRGRSRENAGGERAKRERERERKERERERERERACAWRHVTHLPALRVASPKSVSHHRCLDLPAPPLAFYRRLSA